jgi:hypothetical protein
MHHFIDEVVVTNTVPLSPDAAGVRKIKQLTVAPLLAEAIRRVHANQSLMSMFDAPNGDGKSNNATSAVVASTPAKKA